MNYNQCWLNYNPIKHYMDVEILKNITICLNNQEEQLEAKLISTGTIFENAVKELENAFHSILDIKVNCNREQMKESQSNKGLTQEGYQLKQVDNKISINANTEKGVLYGAFELIRRVGAGESIRGLDILENPENNLRMLNHWDNMGGDIERGYSGQSFFFHNEEVLVNQRSVDYARMVASVGINGVVINNVNVRGAAASGLITDRYLSKVRELAVIFAGYGIKLYISANFAAPMEFGGLTTADPLDEGVANWWKECVSNVYEKIPEFGGLLIKADSEFRPGPFTYNRTHADGANVLAKALKPHGGLLIWRCFVYNCQQDWKDKKTDRARAAYDNFMGLDGKFDNNVILQIKNGPMDFQVREPVSPLIGGLKKTNQMLEVQIAQEYTGQQKHVCYLIPMWKQVLEFNTYVKDEEGTVADIVSGRTFHQTNCGIAAVANTGDDYNWTGHDLSAANLYGYGRLCWNTKLTSEEIAEEWIRLTFPHNDKVLTVMKNILMGSWPTYEKYTSPLGIGWMVNPSHHYGPNVDGYEYAAWGTYHRADRNGMGVDRTKAGTGYTMQYNEPNASMYEQIETCPEELILFFHYVPYEYILKSGVSLIQHIYNTHFEGVLEVEDMLVSWKSLENIIPQDSYKRVLERLQIQLESSVEWRDMINTYFYRKAGIDDSKSRKIFY